MEDLLTTIKTKYDAQMLVEEIMLVQDRLFDQDDGKMEEVLNSRVRMRIAREIRAMRNDVGSRDEQMTVLTELVETIKNLPVMHLTLAYNPTERAVERISEWLTTTIGRQILLEFSFDQSLMGGAIVAYEGKYVDLSLRQVFDTVEQKEAAAIQQKVVA